MGAIGPAGAKPPAFVYTIIPTIFVFFNIFALNMFLQYKKAGRRSADLGALCRDSSTILVVARRPERDDADLLRGRLRIQPAGRVALPGQLVHLAVDPGAHCQQLRRDAIDRLGKYMLTSRCDCVCVSTGETNTPARQLYESMASGL